MMLYRKYRPKRFKAVIGQPSAIGLKNMVIAGTMLSPFLFTGPRGTGKTTLARVLGLAANCSNLQEGEPCLKCKACKKPSIFERDAGSFGDKGSIDTIKDYLSTMPKYKYRVLIIDECHALTKSAQTSLLKILEEPPEKTVIVLATTEPKKLSDALKSRCSWWPIKSVSEDLIAPHIEMVAEFEGLDIDTESCKLIAHDSEGSVRTALSLLDAVSSYNRPITVDLVREALSIVDVRKLVKALIDADIESAIYEATSLNGVYDSPTIQAQVSKDMMDKALELQMQGAEVEATRLRNISAHIYRRIDKQAPSDSLHLLIVISEVFYLPTLNLAPKDVESVDGGELWEGFKNSVLVGIGAGFYPKPIETELQMLHNIKISSGLVEYSHHLDEEASEDIKRIFLLYIESDNIEWRKHANNKRGRTKAGNKNPVKKRRLKRT